MKRKFLNGVILCFILLVVDSCGPSEEAIATMTASAWTPTPLPTAVPTSTPIPYNLDVAITDEENNPLPYASILFEELGEILYSVNEQSVAQFLNLPGELVSLECSAPGYFSSQVTESIERGDNEISVMLTMDPNGLLPSRACLEGEKFLYAEDFQDGTAYGWEQIMNSIVNNAPGWSILEDPENPENKILVAANSSASANSDYKPEGMEPYTNAVWRMKMKIEGEDSNIFLNWLHWPSEDEGEWRYIIVTAINETVELKKFQAPQPGMMGAGQSQIRIKENQWYFFEISTFNGVTKVWLDGEELISYTDPKPFEKGTIGIEANLFEGSNSSFFFDDIAVCGLDAPFVSVME